MLRTLTSMVLLGLTALLAGCSGGSANLSSPILGPDPNTDCTKKPALCTTMVFYDDPVENLRYECGVNKGLTDSEGRFTCPMGLNVLFYLGANKEVKLGSMKVATSEAINHAKDKYVFKDWVMPIDLVRAESPTDSSTCGSDSAWKANVLRLLRSLDHDQKPFNAQEAENRIKIPKEELDITLASHFNADVPVKEFKPCDFASMALFETHFGNTAGSVLTTLNTVLTEDAVANNELNREDGGSLLASAAYATARFEEARRQLLGGTYSIIGPIDLTGVGVTLPTTASHQFIVDRSGVPFGFGLLRRVPETGPVSNLNITYDPFYFPQLPDTESLFAEDGTLTNFVFETRPEATNTNAIGKLTLSGRMINNQIWPFASNYNGSGITPTSSDLGKWSEKNSSNENVSDSQGGVGVHMLAALPVNLSDSAGWNSVVASPVAPALMGATHYALQLDYTDTTRKTLDTLPITILRNGAVVTDLDSDCSLPDAVTSDGDAADFLDVGGQQEYRIGVIGSIRTLGTTKFATLYIAFGIDALRADSRWNIMNGLQMDRAKGEVGLIIAPSTAKHMKLQEISSSGTETEASWVNAIRAQVSALTDPDKEPSADSQGKVVGNVRTPGSGCPT